jgi:anhydro-N-acetylmuramic acid kinase
MSGTSLDGVDLAHCTFTGEGNSYSFSLGACETIPYPATWIEKLRTLPSSTALEYAETHTLYGRYIGELTSKFIRKYKLEADFVASHGHTIFHNPAKKYTSQIGEGAAIAAECGLPVVCDFRTGDVAAGGQGAPLVPIGDELLFADYDYCLNLGGFANISMQIDGKRVAFDISPANIILNHIAHLEGKAFDENGKLASKGRIDYNLLDTLNALNYYKTPPPKSLGREWIEKEILPLLGLANLSHEDILSTFCEHIAIQVAACFPSDPHKQMLVTGGGAFNTFLIDRIASHTSVELIIPDPNIINFKEALVFAFLGMLRMQAKPNSLATVTGASHNVTGGAVYLP